MVQLFENSRDTDQMQLSAASDLGLHCLLFTLFRVCRQQWVKVKTSKIILFKSSS